MKQIFLTIVTIITGYACLLGGFPDVPQQVTIFSLSVLILVPLCFKDIKIKTDTILALIFSVLGVISVLYAPHKWTAILYSASLLSGALFYLVLRNTDEWQDRLLCTLVGCGIINGIIGIFQSFYGTPSGLFYNSNIYSGFLTPLVSLSLYVHFTYKKPILAWVPSFLIFSNLLSNSRAGVLSMTLALLLILFFLWKYNEKKSFVVFIVIICAGFISCMFFQFVKDLLTIPYYDMSFSEPGILDKGIKSVVHKFYQYQYAIKLFLKAPFHGHGINSYRDVIGTVSNPYVSLQYSHAHNIFINIAVELGLAGLMVFIMFIANILKGKAHLSAFFFKSALLSFLIHNLVEYNFPAPIFQVLFYSLAALVASEKEIDFNIIHIKEYCKRVFLVLILSYYVIVVFPPMIGFFYFNKAHKAIGRDDAKTAIRYLLTSNYFGYSVSKLQRDTASILSQIYFEKEKNDDALARLAEQKYITALHLYNLDGGLYVEIARFYRKKGEADRAEKYLIKIVKLFPYNPAYKLELAIFYRETAKPQNAIKTLLDLDEFLERFAPLDPLRASAFLELAENYRTKGNQKLYQDYMGKAVRLRDSITTKVK